jgi:hypothetical protein
MEGLDAIGGFKFDL